MSAPTDNLVRARYDTNAVELRADGDSGRTLFGHFAVFNRWTEIDSWYEGRFLERVAPEAFNRTFKEIKQGKRNVRVLYDHGADPSIGNKPLGAPDMLRADGDGAYYESELFDATYVNDLIPALRAGQLGASFRFRVTGEEWIEPTKPTKANPNKLRERTITDVDLYEFGPVTFPAYSDATAGVRSGTDTFIDRLLNNPVFLARFTERSGLKVVEHILASLPADGQSETTSTEVPAGGRSEDTRTDLTHLRALTVRPKELSLI